MIRINLLPVKSVQKKEMLVGQLIVLAISVTVALLACVGVYSLLASKVEAEKAEIAQKEQEINSLRRAIGEVGRFKNLQKELQGKLDVLDKLKAGQTGPVHLLDELSRAVPKELWIESFSEKNGAVAIRGVGLSEESVATFLRNLERSPYYQNVELQVIEQQNKGSLKLQRFDVTCQTETPPENPAVK